MRLLNVVTVETSRRYAVAPLDAFQASVGVVETPVVPSAGLAKTGIGGDGGGGGVVVVKFQTPDHPLVPDELDALTLQ